MAEIKTVGIKELKNNLSAYLRDVRRGVRILVTDRAEVVAELHEPGATYSVSGDLHPQLEAWVRAEEVTLPTRPKGSLPDPPVHMPDGTARALLDEAREERLR